MKKNMLLLAMNKNMLLLAAILVLVFCASCDKANTGKSKPPETGGENIKFTGQLTGPRNDIPGLPNFAKVSESLYRGGQPTAGGFAALKKMGLNTIVNLRSVQSDRDLLTGLGLHYVHISFKPWNPEEEDLLAFLKIVSDPENFPVFVHCQHGADRTGMVVAIYRVVVQGWDMKGAMKEMPLFRFHNIWSNLRKYLLEINAAELKKKISSAKKPEIDLIP